MSTADSTWTVRRLLEWTTPYFTRKDVDSPRLSAELLLAHVLSTSRIKLYTDYERSLSDRDLATYKALVQRASEHEPIAYLTGRAHFFSLELEVSRDVLIPRPDTETIVENVLQTVRHAPGLESPRILDLCTGSGCVALALAQNLKLSRVIATDISAKAAEIARRNVARLNLADRVSVLEGDLFAALASAVDVAPFHLIVANPPYIPTSQIQSLDRNVRDYEPLAALDGGLDGLVLHRRILADAGAHLLPGGRIYLEIAFDQGPAVAELFAPHADTFEPPRLIKDQSGHDRVVTAIRK